MSNKPCPPQCTCRKHSAETRSRMSETRRLQWAQKNAAERQQFGEHVARAMEERGLVSRPENRRAYHRNHVRVHAARGPARDQRCVGCNSQALHWAQTHGTDGTDPLGHYRPLCRSCHEEYDREIKGAKISASKMGHEVSEEARAKMRAAKLGKKLSPEHVAKIQEGKARRRREREEGRQA